MISKVVEQKDYTVSLDDITEEDLLGKSAIIIVDRENFGMISVLKELTKSGKKYDWVKLSNLTFRIKGRYTERIEAVREAVEKDGFDVLLFDYEEEFRLWLKKDYGVKVYDYE